MVLNAPDFSQFPRPKPRRYLKRIFTVNSSFVFSHVGTLLPAPGSFYVTGKVPARYSDPVEDSWTDILPIPSVGCV